MPRVNLTKLKVGIHKNQDGSIGRKSRSGSQASISSFFTTKSNADTRDVNTEGKTSGLKRPAIIVLDDDTDLVDSSKGSKKPKLSPSHGSSNSAASQQSTPVSTTTLSKLKDFEIHPRTPIPRSNSKSMILEQSNLKKVSYLCLDTINSKRQEEDSIVCKKTSPKSNDGALDIVQFSRKKASDVSVDKNEKTTTAEKFTVNQRTKTPYTPLEAQFMEIKEQYSDAVLFIECGYKYKFFGADAEVAAKELNIMCFMNHNFMVASIPTHRLHVHVRRLVSKGYKVGVVKQTETAALKAAGENKSTVFTRELHALYTKSTLIGEDIRMTSDVGGAVDDEVVMETGGSYLMCVCEDSIEVCSKSLSSKCNIDGITYGILAVQPSTGEIIYDEFHDNPSCSELETRLEHIALAELLIPSSLSPRTQSFINDFTSQASRPEEAIRIEYIAEELLTKESAVNTIREFCAGSEDKNTVNSPKRNENVLLHKLLNLPKTVLMCYAALVHYLKDFKLDQVMKLASNFVKFSTKAKFMKLNGCTLRNLEVLKSQSGGEKSTLLWILNHTRTSFGKRMLKKWISQPLLDKREIELRLDSVSKLASCSSDLPCLQKLCQMISQLPDLERGLCSIYYKKCSTKEFLTIVKALNKLSSEFRSVKDVAEREMSSPMLTRTFTKVPELLQGTDEFLAMIDKQAAKNGDKTKLFADSSRFSEVDKCHQDISRIMSELRSHRSVIRRTLQHPSIDYCTVAGNEFLIEVKNAKLSSVPTDWIKISATKQVCRFRTPFVEEQFKLLCQQRETLALVCHAAWLQFLDMFCVNYSRYNKAVQLVAVTDCLLSLATVARQPGFVRPVIKEGPESSVTIKQGRHPIIDTLLPEHAQYVPNDTDMQTRGVRCMIVTGPNMGGKSSYIKQVALISIMTQIGSYVPAQAVELTPLDAIYTRMGASDNIYKGRSTFMVELQEASEILQQATPRSLVILDELGRGTSTHDGVAIAYATLQHLITQVRSLTLFVTHYPSLAELERAYPNHVTNNHMAFMTSGGDVSIPDDVINKGTDTPTSENDSDDPDHVTNNHMNFMTSGGDVGIHDDVINNRKDTPTSENYSGGPSHVTNNHMDSMTSGGDISAHDDVIDKSRDTPTNENDSGDLGHVTNNHMDSMTSDIDVSAHDDVINKSNDNAMTMSNPDKISQHLDNSDNNNKDVVMSNTDSKTYMGDDSGTQSSVAMETPSVTFLYKLVQGAAARSYGLNVALLAGVSPEIIAVAAGKSRDLESEIASRRSSKSLFVDIWQAQGASDIKSSVNLRQRIN